MRTCSIILRVAALGAVVALGACSMITQTTSGQDWLAAYPAAKGAPLSSDDMDAQVRKVAAVEPTLRFPARIGIARLGPTGLMPIPSEEAQRWSDVAGHLGPGYGELIPISPMVAAMVEQPLQATSRMSYARHTIDTVRLAAARQHLDAVLVYEVDGTADARDTPVSLAEWTLIGAFVLPTKNVKAVGVAQAMLIDVRNGYPYGTIRSSADDKSLSTAIGSRGTRDRLRDEVMANAVTTLTGEAEGMMRKLKPELAALDLRSRTH